MTYKTHLTAGVAMSLAVCRPSEFGALAMCICGAAMGSIISDIDSSASKPRKEFKALVSGVAGIMAIAIVLEVVFKIGIVHRLAVENLLGVVSLALFVVLGMQSKHRTFTHSILGIVIFTGIVSLISTSLTAGFLVGMVSHVGLDLLNKKRVQLFYPLKKPKIGFNLCYADGKVASVLSLVAMGAILLELALFAKNMF